jgi:hypothetical protein
MNKIELAVLWLAMLLVGCGGSLRGDANAGPNPDGGFYSAPMRIISSRSIARGA